MGLRNLWCRHLNLWDNTGSTFLSKALTLRSPELTEISLYQKDQLLNSHNSLADLTLPMITSKEIVHLQHKSILSFTVTTWWYNLCICCNSISQLSHTNLVNKVNTQSSRCLCLLWFRPLNQCLVTHLCLLAHFHHSLHLKAVPCKDRTHSPAYTHICFHHLWRLYTDLHLFPGNFP